MEEQKRKKNPPLDKEKVLELHNQGLTQVEIAKELGSIKSTVNNILKTFGKTTAQIDKNASEERIIELNAKGLSNPEIAKELNIHRDTVHNIVTKYNLPKRKNPEARKATRKFDPTKEELIEMLSSKSVVQISKEIGISEVTIYKKKKSLKI